MSRPEEKPRFSWKIGLPILACLIVTGWVVRLVWTSDGLSEFEAYEMELKERGYATHPKDLLTLGVPDEENSSVLWNRLPGLPNIQTRRLPVDDVSSFFGNLTAEQEDEFLEAVETNDPFLELLRDATKRPYHTYTEQDFSRPLHEWKAVSYMGVSPRYKLLFCAAVHNASEGNLDEAISLWTLGVRSMRHFTETQFSLMSLMLGVNLLEPALDAGEIIFQYPEVETEDLTDAIMELKGVSLIENLAVSFELQSIHMLKGYELILEGHDFGTNLLLGPGKYQGLRDRLDPILVIFLRGAIGERLLEVHAFALEEVDIIESPPVEWPEKFKKLYAKEDEKDWLEETFPRLNFRPQFRDLSEEVLKKMVRNHLFRLGLACRLYRMENGSAPESLDSVAPDYIEKIPKDLYTGDEFKYEILDDGFLLYSVGPNREDEQGEGDDLPF